MNQTRIFELNCGVMNYDWGQVGDKSLVAQLAKLKPFDPSLPYAELWMGIHPNCPSRVRDERERYLANVLDEDPSLLGEYTYQRWGQLPFLLKILSIDKPLSIQAHPDKLLAEQLHETDPDHYPDNNHKPEIAVALSDLNLLYGLDHQVSVQDFITRYPFLNELMISNKNKTDPLKTMVNVEEFLKTMLSIEQPQIDQFLDNMSKNLRLKQTNLIPNERLFFEQYPNYPGDSGLVLTFFMNILQLKVGDALFLEPYQLHAYLRGDLAECMANSDNVIRAGMTNKYKDLNTLKSMISRQIRQEDPLCRQHRHEFTTYYKTPAEEFEIHKISIARNNCLKYINPHVPEILIILSGSGTLESAKENVNLTKGTVLFIAAKTDYAILASENLDAIRGTVPNPVSK